MKLTKEKAINEITGLINEITNVYKAGRLSTEHIRWIHNCHHILAEIFGKKSTYFHSFASLKWYETGSYPVYIWETIEEAIEEKNNQAFGQCLQMAEGIFLAAIDDIKRSDDISDVYKDKKENDSSLLIKLFNTVTSKFRIFFQDEPKIEKDVQDNFERLLVGSDLPYTREKVRIIYSTKTYIPDFIIDDISLAIEIKLCNREGKEKEIISEINDDILAYNTKYKNSMFVIYDIGQIRDIEQYKSSFKLHDNIIIIIIKH